MKGGASLLPSLMDGATGEGDILEVFEAKYNTLYCSVPFAQRDMDELLRETANDVAAHEDGCAQCEHSITRVDVSSAVKRLKPNRSDGMGQCLSNNFLQGSELFFQCLARLFNSLVLHGVAPDELLMSTLVPIPKDKRKSLSSSSNYRAIALSSIVGKVLDHVLLAKCQDTFSTSPWQYGFKKKLSTNHCTFVVKETIQHYLNNDSRVYLCLLDATAAFDRVEYVKLFKLLKTRDLCPIICRFLLLLYTSQSIRIRWGKSCSPAFDISNGVKQGGVMSPILFTVYIDELLTRLSQCGDGCYVGRRFHGAFGYADDVCLLSPSLAGLTRMLSVCDDFALEYKVKFNASKSKLIAYGDSATAAPANVSFMGGNVTTEKSAIYLGNLIGEVSHQDLVQRTVKDFLVKTNMVRLNFKLIPPDACYRLFKTYCMPLYGTQLFDLSDPSMSKLYTEWRKSIRYLLHLPYQTHCSLLPLICNDTSVQCQLQNRSLRFIRSLSNSSNPIVQNAFCLAMCGSGSNIANSISFLSSIARVNRNSVTNLTSMPMIESPENESIHASVINDLLHMRYISHFDESIFSCNEIDFMIHTLCVN